MMCTVPTSNGFAGIRTVEIPETELLLDILAGTADGAFAVDENHRIAFWNESAAKILGFSSTEATGRLCYELVGGLAEAVEGICSPQCPVITEGLTPLCPPSFELSILTNSGTRRWVSFSTLVGPVQRNGNRITFHFFHPLRRQDRMEEFACRVIREAHKLGVADALQPLHHERDGHRVSKLTKREREVLRLMARGGKMEEIAKNLSISMATARWYSQRILNELGVHSRALPIDAAKARRNPCPGPSAGPGIASFNWAAVFQPRKLARRATRPRPTCAPSRTDCRKILLYLAWFNPPSMGSSYMVDAGGG